jgi:hypothetical protein
VANYLWLLNDGTSRILLNNGTDKLALNEEVPAEAHGWQQPASEPRRHYSARRAAASVAMAAGCVWAPFSPTGTGDAVAATNHTPVVFQKTIIYDDYVTAPYQPEVAETVTVDKWFAELGQPRKRRGVTGEEVSIVGPVVQPEASDIGWHRALSEPPRRVKVSYPGALLYTPQPEANDLGWYAPLQTPTLRKVGRQSESVVAPTQPQVGDISWHRSLSEPTRRKLSYEGLYVYPYRSSIQRCHGNGL